MSDLHVRVGDRECTAEWVESNPETRGAIESALPLSGEGRKWGKELYFRTAVDVKPEETSEEVPVGAVAYWPAGNAICLFWGPTPASRDGEPRAAAPVNVVARLDDPDLLSGAEDGERIELTG